MRELVRPFLLPEPGRIHLGPWALLDDDREAPLPEALDTWDCSTTLRIARHVDIDVDGLLRDCGLGPGSRLSAGLVWSSSSTRMRGAGGLVTLQQSTQHTASIRPTCVVPGSNSGGILSVSIVVALALAEDPSHLAATIPGSVLFEDSTNVALEGIAAQFPTAVCDFSADLGFPDQDAPWFLEWSPEDLDLPPDAALLLWVNSRCEPVVDAVASDDHSRPELVWLRRSIALETVTSLLCGALQDERFIDPDWAFDAGSLADVLRSLLRSWFPGFPFADLADASRSRPSHFRARVAARMRLFGYGGDS